jgi:hypothetical protein
MEKGSTSLRVMVYIVNASAQTYTVVVGKSQSQFSFALAPLAHLMSIQGSERYITKKPVTNAQLTSMHSLLHWIQIGM